ncbi:MAG: hypothetical protein M1825_001531 [Sarcosagium campestre]|nr:MAG: hypothetical protein M1825_001531 [Sarcosagium campestre]
MASPAKKRKKNDFGGSPSATKSLDFFFGKQQLEKRQRAAQKQASDAPTNNHLKPEEDRQSEHSSAVLTDEELARKLQAEWNSQDAFGTEPPSSSNIQDAQSSPAEQSDVLPNEDLQTGDNDHIKVSIGDTKEANPPIAESNDKTLKLQSAASSDDTVASTIPFDESPLTFSPGKYTSVLQEHWQAEGGDSTYATLTRCFVLVNSTQSRIKIVDTLTNFLRLIIEADPQSVLPAVWLATNSISPAYISLELGLGGSAISKALKKVCGLDNQSLRNLYNKHGDAGDVAFEAKKRQNFTLRKPKPLTIKGVYAALVKIANTKGNGSQEVKQRIVDRLLQDARGAEESRYLIRTLGQHLRIGAVKTTMLIALSRAVLLSRPAGVDYPVHLQEHLRSLKKDELTEIYAKSEEIIKACYARRPNYGDLVPALLEVGSCDELLARCGLALHVPLRPMLGSITRDLSDMLTKLQGRHFSCEFKYDGQRAQVHCDAGGKVSIFSRHLELMTDKYPDLVALVPQIRGESVSSFIMEGEVVAVDRQSGDLKTFQTLAGRGRKDVAIGSVKVDVCLFAFDLMYLNGEELLDRSFRERRELLRSLFAEIPNRFTWVKNIDATSADSETVLEFFKSATDIKCEGIMVKVLDNAAAAAAAATTTTMPDGGSDGEPDGGEAASTQPNPPGTLKRSASSNKTAKRDKDKASDKEKPGRRKALLSTYEPDKRLESWLKVKKDYNTTSDTLDLIPVAGWHGQGRKAKWWSPILMAARDPVSGSLVAVCKCISGFTDKFYAANKEKYAQGGPNVLASRPMYIEYGGSPEVWFEPQEVWEMAFADVTLSPTYTAAMGLVSEDRGLSLRFPRFLKLREDKSIEEASTCDFLADLYRKQEERAPKVDADDNLGDEMEQD